MCATQINRICVQTEGTAVVDAGIHIAGGVEVIHAVTPPPTDIGGIIILIKDAFTVGSQRFIQPRLNGMVVANQPEPPLMRDLMHADSG